MPLTMKVNNVGKELSAANIPMKVNNVRKELSEANISDGSAQLKSFHMLLLRATRVHLLKPTRSERWPRL